MPDLLTASQAAAIALGRFGPGWARPNRGSKRVVALPRGANEPRVDVRMGRIPRRKLHRPRPPEPRMAEHENRKEARCLKLNG